MEVVNKIPYTFLLILIISLSGCGPAMNWNDGFRYDSQWSMNLFEACTTQNPQIQSIEVYHAKKDDGYAKPYEVLKTLPLILNIKNQEDITRFILAAQTCPPKDPKNVPTMENLNEIYHIVIWSDGRKESAYGVLLVYRKQDFHYEYIKPWSESGYYQFNSSLYPLIKNLTKR